MPKDQPKGKWAKALRVAENNLTYGNAAKVYGAAKVAYNKGVKVVNTVKNTYAHYRKGSKTIVRNGRTGSFNGSMAKDRGTVVLNKKLKGKTAGKWKYSQSHEIIITGTAGMQRPSVANIICSKEQLFTSAGAAYSIGQNHTALNELNPYLKISGSTLLTAGTKPATDKFAIRSIRSSMEIGNTGGTGCTVTVAWYLSKRSHTANVVDTWDVAMQDSNPTALPNITFPSSATTNATAGYPTILIPGQKPYSSRAFRAGFKQVWKDDFQMATGAVKNISVNFIYNKIIDQGKLSGNPATNLPMLAGISLSCVVTIRGQVVTDITNAGVNRATYATPQVAIVMHNEYIMCGVYGNAGRLDTAYSAIDIPCNVPVGNQTFMNDAHDLEINEITL